LAAKVEYVVGDISKADDVMKACEGADCVWHIAALVGPYYKHSMYHAVNYIGTLNVLEACKKFNIPRLVMSSSPSTRFDGSNVAGAKEEDVKIQEKGKFLQVYAETKAMAEIAVREACSDSLMTIAVAPHQVYGPRDPLFLTNFLYAADTGALRILGSGKNHISMTHVDNYCHGLILAYDKLVKGSPVLGKYYVVTDGPKQNFWEVLNQAIVGTGRRSLKTKFSVPYMILMPIAIILQGFTYLFGVSFRLTPFTVKMMTIDRWFDITNAKRDLGYEPIIPFQQGWADTIAWFKEHEDWWMAKAKQLALK